MAYISNLSTQADKTSARVKKNPGEKVLKKDTHSSAMKWLGQWRINCMSLIQSKAFGQNTTDYWRVQWNQVIHNTRAFARYESAANRSRMKKEATHIIFLKDTKMPSIDWSFGSEHFSTNKVSTLCTHRHWQWMTKYSMLSASLKASNLGPLILFWGHYQTQTWF